MVNDGGTVTLKGLDLTDGYTQVDGETKLNGGTCNVTGENVDIQGGTLFLEAGTLNAALGVEINTGALLTGSGTIQGDLHNSGSIHVGGVNSPGSITVQGDFTQTAGGTTKIELGGLQAGTDYDQLAVTGTATLAGTLDISLINNFTPNVGDTFDVLTYGNHQGMFGTINGLNLGGGKTLDPDYQATKLELDTK